MMSDTITTTSSNSAIQAGKTAQAEKVPQKTMVLYGFGQVGAQLFRDAPAALLPLFMTTMLGISPWLAGMVILVPKIWLIFCDPIIGAMSDHYKPRYGRKPFLVFGAILTSLSFMALFAFSNFASPLWAAATVCVLFFIASTAFSAFSVPYLAVASELSSDPHERTKILSYRIIFAVVGVVMGVGLAQPLVFQLGGDAAAWRTMAIVFGSISLLAMLATAYGVPINYGKAHTVDPKKLLTRLSVVMQNKAFVVLSSTFFVQSIAQASGYAVVAFVFIYAIQDINLLLPFVMVMATGSILSQPLWLKLSANIGKQGAFWIACVGWMLVTFTWLWVAPGDDVLFSLPFWGEMPTEHFLVLIRAFIIGCTNAAFSVLTFSLMTDTIDNQRIKHGNVDEGVFSGVFSAFEKLAFALGPMLAGVVLSLSGFQSSTGGVIVQGTGAIDGMVWLYSTIPSCIMALSLLIFSRYNKALSA